MSVLRLPPLVAIFMLVPLGPLAIDIFLPSLADMAAAFSASNGDMQLTISIYVFVLGISQLLAGPVSDRRGRRSSALIGLILYATGAAGVVLSPSLPWVYAGRLLQGSGAAFTMVTAMAWIRDNYSGREAAKWLSYASGITAATPTIAPFIGSLMATYFFWQGSFVFMGTLAAALALVCAVSLTNKTNAEGRDTQPQIPLLPNLKAMAGNRQFITYATANTISFSGLLSYISLAPMVALKEIGMTTWAFSMIFGGIGVVQMVSSFLAPALIQWFGERIVVLIGLLLVLTAGIGLWLSPTLPAQIFFVYAAVGAAGFSVAIGAATSLNLQPFKHCAGLAASVDGFMRMSVGAAIAAIAGYSGLSSFQTLAGIYTLAVVPIILVMMDIRQLSRCTPNG